MYTNVHLPFDTLMSTTVFEKTGNHPVFNLIMHKGCQAEIADISNIQTINYRKYASAWKNIIIMKKNRQYSKSLDKTLFSFDIKVQT